MTGATLKTFTENLLDGETINGTFFYQLLNIAKSKIEADRAWMILIDEDTSNSVTTANTFETSHDLPSDYISLHKAFLKDGDNNIVWLFPIPFEQKYTYKDAPRRYYVDEANKKIYLTGNINKSYTLVLFYHKESTELASGVTWSFPSRFHTILGFMVAEMYKAGVDYDDISVQQAVQHSRDAQLIWDAMIDWDSKLQYEALGGQYSDHMASTDSDGLPQPDDFETPLSMM